MLTFIIGHIQTWENESMPLFNSIFYLFIRAYKQLCEQITSSDNEKHNRFPYALIPIDVGGHSFIHSSLKFSAKVCILTCPIPTFLFFLL